MDVKLQVLSGRAKGRKIPLPGTIFVIGRGKHCHLRPHSRLVSNLHCAIASWAGKVAVRDLKSTNGTFVNDQRVHGETRVHHGDVLRVGALTFTILIEASAEVPVMPVVHETDVRWLVAATHDTAEQTAAQTVIVEGDGPAPAATPSAAELSAGDLLRDYLRQRK